MSMDNVKDRTYFAQKYKVAEVDIPGEFMPLLMAFDEVSEQNRHLIERVEKITNPVTNEHYYDGMSAGSAFFLRWGWGVWVFGLGIVLAGAWLVVEKNRLDLDRDRVELQKLQRVLVADSTGTYRVSSDRYEISRGKGFKGIVLKIPEE